MKSGHFTHACQKVFFQCNSCWSSTCGQQKYLKVDKVTIRIRRQPNNSTVELVEMVHNIKDIADCQDFGICLVH